MIEPYPNTFSVFYHGKSERHTVRRERHAPADAVVGTGYVVGANEIRKRSVAKCLRDNNIITRVVVVTSRNPNALVVGLVATACCGDGRRIRYRYNVVCLAVDIRLTTKRL